MSPRCPCDVCAEQRLVAERVIEASAAHEATRRADGALGPQTPQGRRNREDARRRLLLRAQEYGAAMARACLRQPVTH